MYTDVHACIHTYIHTYVCRLLRYGAQVNVLTSEAQTPLHWAASMGHSKIVRMLLEAGADPGIETLGTSITALQIAIANGHSLLADEMRDFLGLRHRALR